MDDESWLRIAMYAFLVCTIIAAVLYLYPRFFTGAMIADKIKEGFTTTAVDSDTMPRCFIRDLEAQELIADLSTAVKGMPPGSDRYVKYDEFKLIVQKALCIDADVTGLGTGTYSTYGLPFNTHHDMEPVASFVGRCLRNAVRDRDLELTFGKLQDRGNELLREICPNEETRAKAYTMFHNIMARSLQHTTKACMQPRATMDVPAGKRDPGYFTPVALTNLSEYKPT